MNILYIDHYAGSIKYGMEFRPYYLAREWKKLGHNVRIIAGDYSHLRVENPIVNKDMQLDNVDGIEFQWLKTGEYSGNGVKRALTMFRFVRKMKKYAKRIVDEFKPNVIITSSTYPLDTYGGQKIAKLSGGKLIHEIHDMWPITPIEINNMSPNNPFIRILQRGENSFCKNSDIVVSLLPCAEGYLKEHGLKDNKFVHIPNGVVLEDWENPEEMPEQHKKILSDLKKDGKFIVMYTGGHALSNALDIILDAAKLSKEDEKIVYVLVGKGVEKARLENRVKEEKLENVVFLPAVKKLQIPSVIKEADAVVLVSKKVGLYRYGVSLNKVYDYMMASKPIIYGVDAGNNEVEEAQAGITIEPESAESLNKSVYEILSLTDEERKIMGENGKSWVENNCSYSILAERFLKIME